MKIRGHLVLACVGVAVAALGCGEGARVVARQVGDYVRSVGSSDGRAQGALAQGVPPAPSGGPDADAAVGAATLVLGGASLVNVSAGVPFASILIAVEGADGYYEVTLAEPAGEAELVVALSQAPPAAAFTFEFAVVADGQVGAYVSVPVEVASVTTGDVQVSVSWGTAADLGLAVVEPSGESIDAAHPVSATGGLLDQDANGGCQPTPTTAENIAWPEGGAPLGTYAVSVAQTGDCGVALTKFAVTVQRTGQPPLVFVSSFGGPAGTEPFAFTFIYAGVGGGPNGEPDAGPDADAGPDGDAGVDVAPDDRAFVLACAYWDGSAERVDVIDVATGSASFVGVLGDLAAWSGQFVVSADGMVAHAIGYPPGESFDQQDLYTLDLTTGQSRQVPVDAYYMLAGTTLEGGIVAADVADSFSATPVVVLDPETGIATAAGTLEPVGLWVGDGNGALLARYNRALNRLYALSRSEDNSSRTLHALDLDDGATSSIPLSGAAGYFQVGGVRDDGTLVGELAETGSVQRWWIATLDPATGVVSTVIEMALDSSDGRTGVDPLADMAYKVDWSGEDSARLIRVDLSEPALSEVPLPRVCVPSI